MSNVFKNGNDFKIQRKNSMKIVIKINFLKHDSCSRLPKLPQFAYSAKQILFFRDKCVKPQNALSANNSSHNNLFMNNLQQQHLSPYIHILAIGHLPIWRVMGER